MAAYRAHGRRKLNQERLSFTTHFDRPDRKHPRHHLSPSKPRVRPRTAPRLLAARTLHQWHWIHSPLCLVGLLLFALAGFRLNHTAQILASPNSLTVRAADGLAPRTTPALESYLSR